MIGFITNEATSHLAVSHTTIDLALVNAKAVYNFGWPREPFKYHMPLSKRSV